MQVTSKLPGFEVFTAVVMKNIIFWDMTPYSPLSFHRWFEGTYRLHLQGRRNKFSKNQQARRWQVFRLAEYSCLPVFAELISSTLKMEAICSFETSVETQRTIRRHIPEDDTLQASFFRLHSDPTNGINTFLRNVGGLHRISPQKTVYPSSFIQLRPLTTARGGRYSRRAVEG
jgi:hypothetical protein